MSDRTQHIIDAIDGALEDWSVSVDAMRWTPEPEAEPEAELVIWRPSFVSPDQLTELQAARPEVRVQIVAEVAHFAVQLGGLVERVRQVFNASPEALTRLRWVAGNLALRQSPKDVRQQYRRRRRGWR